MHYERTSNLFEEVSGGTVFLRITDGADWIVLDGTAETIWSMCVGIVSVESLVASLSEQFSADHRLMQVDVTAFANELVALGLLKVAEDDV